MKFNNKWDVLPDKEANNRQRKRRLRLYRREGIYDQLGIFGEMAHVQRGRWAQGKSRMKETEKWKRRQWTGYEASVLVSGVHALSRVQLVPGVCVLLAQRVWLFATPWTVAYQAPPSMGFSRQECWSGLPFPSSRGSSRPRNWTRVSCIAGRLSEVNVKILLMTISWNWDFMEVLIIFVYKHFVFLYYLLHVWRKPELPLLKLQDLSYKVTKGKASGHFYIIVNYLWSDSYGSLRRSAVEPGTNLHFTYPNCW